MPLGFDPIDLTRAEAVRFLQRTTFGGTPAECDRLQAIGAIAWLNEQMVLPRPVTYLERRLDSGEQFSRFIWADYLSAPDQLRRRWAYALSQLFVVSRRELPDQRVAHFADLLETHCFGTYRNLLETVTRSVAMGDYLTYEGNRREDARRGRVPDENYAREVMQLFSIGLWELNADGTRRLDGTGAPIPAYGQDDILGLARVFTGFDEVDIGETDWLAHYTAPMDSTGAYAQRYHETGQKEFLGTSIPASDTRTLDESLAIALDALADHPNTAPFVSRLLIQRLITSNPSPAYVGRVAAVFADNGLGVRGDLSAVLRAIVLDAAAWQPSPPADFGKLREPVLRLTTLARSMTVTSTGTPWPIDSLSDAASELGQQPFEPPSVFNFFRPGYVPPQSPLGDAGLVAPEMQITNETTAIGWVNYVARFLRRPPARTYRRGEPDEYRVEVDFDRDDLLAMVSSEFVDQPAAEQLVDELAGRLCPHGLDAGLRSIIVQHVRSITSDRYRPDRTDQSSINFRNDIHLDRVVATAMMIAVSPDFLHER